MRAIICKDSLQNVLLRCTPISETENIKYSIEEVPNIEERDGFTGDYVLNEQGVVEVVYTPIPQTKLEVMQAKLEDQEQLIAELMLLIAGGAK